jgi:hypothetical protein
MNRSLLPGGLCQACAHVRTITSARGSTFLLCTRAANDPRFPKYPPQPVWVCSGFEPFATGERPPRSDGGVDQS